MSAHLTPAHHHQPSLTDRLLVPPLALDRHLRPHSFQARRAGPNGGNHLQGTVSILTPGTLLSYNCGIGRMLHHQPRPPPIALSMTRHPRRARNIIRRSPLTTHRPPSIIRIITGCQGAGFNRRDVYFPSGDPNGVDRLHGWFYTPATTLPNGQSPPVGGGFQCHHHAPPSPSPPHPLPPPPPLLRLLSPPPPSA